MKRCQINRSAAEEYRWPFVRWQEIGTACAIERVGSHKAVGGHWERDRAETNTCSGLIHGPIEEWDLKWGDAIGFAT